MDWQWDWNWNTILDTIKSWLLLNGVKIVLALIFLFLAMKLINFITKRIIRRAEKASEKKHLDKTLMRVIAHTLRIVLKICVVVGVIGYLGIDTSGVTAVIASLGVGIGLAVNGALANFAGGVLLIVTRPFHGDDFISACGFDGTVEDIRLCHTKIRTPDNKVIYIPNGTLSSSTIVNFSEKDVRRVDLTFSISYTADFEKAKAIVTDVILANKAVLSAPAPTVRVSAHSESSIDLTARMWTKNGDYWNVRFDMLENVKKAFDKAGIEIPYNQLDVHLKEDSPLAESLLKRKKNDTDTKE